MTRRTQFKGTSRARRRERLKAKALANGVLAREEAITSEVLHRPPLAGPRFRPKENTKRQNALKTQNHFSSWRKMHSGNWKNTDAIWSGQPLCTQMSLDISHQKPVYVCQT